MYRLNFSGNTSTLTQKFYPPLELRNGTVCGFIHFSTYNSIKNITENNNLFYIGDNIVLTIKPGAYEIVTISNLIKNYLRQQHTSEKIEFELKVNENTLCCEIYCSKPIHFGKPKSMASLLGYPPNTLAAKKNHTSINSVSIIPVNIINIKCDIISNSYQNGKNSNILHSIALNVPPGYKIVEQPSHINYLPVNLNEINSITLQILDQNGNLIDFSGETIDISIYLTPYFHYV